VTYFYKKGLDVLKPGGYLCFIAPNKFMRAATFSASAQLERLDQTFTDIAFTMPVASLKEEGWNLEHSDVLSLMEKLRSADAPLGEYVRGRFYRGVLTGLNEAFVIDAATRERLITADPASAELIKHWLRGRDIRKWKTNGRGSMSLTFPAAPIINGPGRMRKLKKKQKPGLKMLSPEFMAICPVGKQN